MTRIGLVHHDLMQRGGAEAVAVNVIESLQDRYDLTLVTTRRPDFDEINAFFASNLSDVSVRTWDPPIGGIDTLQRLLCRVSGSRLGLLHEALFLRFVESIGQDFDVIVSTRNECHVGVPSVQYVNFPRRGLMSARRRGVTRDVRDHASFTRALYERLCLSVSRFDPERYRPEALVANSEWTAGLLRDLYGETPEVVYPPVDTRGFEEIPWSEREDGFLCVGRLTPKKNVLRTFEILDRVRKRGHDVHLHVVGPADDPTYSREVSRHADDREYVRLHGAVSRDRLVRMISNHRYGIHGKEREHFGMVVAEFLAGGAVPFVPHEGGQYDIVEGREDQVYASVDDAVDTIDRVLSTPDLQARLREDPETIRDRFGRERFQRDIRGIVDEVAR